MSLLYLLLSLYILSICSAAKIVMLPMFGRSHYLVLSKLGEELANRGHEVLILVGDSEKTVIGKPNTRVFKLDENLCTTMASFALQRRGTPSLEKAKELVYLWTSYCDALLSDKDAMNEVKNSELVIGDSLYLCSSLVAAKFSLPHVTIVMSTLSTPTLQVFGVHNPPPYAPQAFSWFVGDLGFFQRVQNIILWTADYLLCHYLLFPGYGDIKAKHNIVPNESYEATLGRVDLIIGQVDFPIESPRPLLPNTKVVGPFMAGPAKPLNEELEEFMQSAGDEGVILVAFGTHIEFLEVKVLKMMATAFSKLPQKVIWKIEREKITFPLSKDIKTLSWLPQNDILGHGQVKLFFSHGGMNGLFESIYHGVPLVITPFFGDQFLNAALAKHNGIAESIDLESITADELVRIMGSVMTKASYKENVLRLSKLIKLKPRPPVSEAAEWIEYLLAQGSLAHLRLRELDMPFYQLYMLDVLFVVVVFLIVVLLFVVFLIKRVARCICGSAKKEKTG